MFSSCRAARLFIADETTTSIIEIHSAVERSKLWKLRNPHQLNQFDIYENRSRPAHSNCRASSSDHNARITIRLCRATPGFWSITCIADQDWNVATLDEMIHPNAPETMSIALLQ
jgi:hypothetical protein